jgi:GLPGLI family protein
MRKLFPVLLFLGASVSGYSQVVISDVASSGQTYQTKDTATAVVTYKYRYVMDTTQPDNPVVNDVVLLLGKDKSRYAYKGQSGVAPRPVNITTTVSGGMVVANVPANAATGTAPAANKGQSMFMTTGNIFKDLGNDLFSMVEYAGGKFFSVEQKIPVINWAIDAETKEIGGLQCQKATGRFKGRDYTAWFCSQLPYSNGPWKLGGLPGLILEAYDTNKEVWFSFVSIENTLPVTAGVGIPEAALHTTAKEFEQYKEALKRDSQANAGSTVAGSITVTGVLRGGTFSANGKPVKPRQNNNPVEKDDQENKKNN